jgi:hypothetical protein
MTGECDQFISYSLSQHLVNNPGSLVGRRGVSSALSSNLVSAPHSMHIQETVQVIHLVIKAAAIHKNYFIKMVYWSQR